MVPFPGCVPLKRSTQGLPSHFVMARLTQLPLLAFPSLHLPTGLSPSFRLSPSLYLPFFHVLTSPLIISSPHPPHYLSPFHLLTFHSNYSSYLPLQPPFSPLYNFLFNSPLSPSLLLPFYAYISCLFYFFPLSHLFASLSVPPVTSISPRLSPCISKPPSAVLDPFLFHLILPSISKALHSRTFYFLPSFPASHLPTVTGLPFSPLPTFVLSSSIFSLSCSVFHSSFPFTFHLLSLS